MKRLIHKAHTVRHSRPDRESTFFGIYRRGSFPPRRDEDDNMLTIYSVYGKFNKFFEKFYPTGKKYNPINMDFFGIFLFGIFIQFVCILVIRDLNKDKIDNAKVTLGATVIIFGLYQFIALTIFIYELIKFATHL